MSFDFSHNSSNGDFSNIIENQYKSIGRMNDASKIMIQRLKLQFPYIIFANQIDVYCKHPEFGNIYWNSWDTRTVLYHTTYENTRIVFMPLGNSKNYENFPEYTIEKNSYEFDFIKNLITDILPKFFINYSPNSWIKIKMNVDFSFWDIISFNENSPNHFMHFLMVNPFYYGYDDPKLANLKKWCTLKTKIKKERSNLQLIS